MYRLLFVGLVVLYSACVASCSGLCIYGGETFGMGVMQGYAGCDDACWAVTS